MSFNEKLENSKLSLHNSDNALDICENPAVKSTITSLIEKIPFFGKLITESTHYALVKFQKSKREELIEIILDKQENITTEMVNDVEFLINFAKTVEAVDRLATNDKVKYFANLLKNGYLSKEKISADRFDNYSKLLNDLSFSEIEYLVFLRNFEIANIDKKDNHLKEFEKSFCEKFNTDFNDLMNTFTKLQFTGLIDVRQSVFGSVSEHDEGYHGREYSFNDGEISTDYFSTSLLFREFEKMVLCL